MPLPIAADVAGIGVGGGNGCAIKTDGSVWCWGTSRDGELGIGSTADTAGPAEVTALAAPPARSARTARSGAGAATAAASSASA
jgi:hypothetical protein